MIKLTGCNQSDFSSCLHSILFYSFGFSLNGVKKDFRSLQCQKYTRKRIVERSLEKIESAERSSEEITIK